MATPADWRNVLAHVFLLQTFIPGEIGTINGSFWSIALEAQLYLTFPLLVMVWRRFGVAAIVIGTAIMSTAWWAIGHANAWVLGDDHVIFDRLVQFAVGVWAAERLATGRTPARRWLWVGFVAGGIAAAADSSFMSMSVGRSVLWAIPAASALLLAANRFQHRLIGMPLERLGLVSYSFYLLQQPVLLVTSQTAHKATDSPILLLLLGVTICLALTAGLMSMAMRKSPSVAR